MSAPLLSDAAQALVATAARFYERGWALGTSGNFSTVLSTDPIRLAMSASGVAKGSMRPSDILVVDEHAGLVGTGSGAPSAEALLHVEIVKRRGARAVLHTHSVWSTVLSGAFGAGIEIEGFEMLKGLAGVRTHEHREWIPIVDNDQDMSRLSGVVGRTLDAHPAAHAILLRRHGLYTWGTTLADAERHVEILEFLFETVGHAQQFFK